MKSYAVLILVVLLLSIFFEPFFEMIEIFSEKAQINSAVESAAKSARLTGFKITDISNLNQRFNFDMDSGEETFISVFCDVFASSLNLEFDYVADNKAYFKSLNKKYNGFIVEFIYDSSEPDKCKVIVTTNYKFKTKYMKEIAKLTTPFELKRERVFYARMQN